MNRHSHRTVYLSVWGLVASVYLVQVIGVKVKRYMSKRIQYSNKPLGDLKVVPDFLPSPEELPLQLRIVKCRLARR